ncbi:hypothetical protein [Paraburkholderia tropica]|uniref:hypothetical protein n=1 Tax=Paraburkholderia tropica TaxID=92647 RepID=UPI001F477E6E|nr:hypothetical protein [Paraburkholderia tropica]
MPHIKIDAKDAFKIENILNENPLCELPSHWLNPVEEIIDGFLPIFESIEFPMDTKIRVDGNALVGDSALNDSINAFPIRNTQKYLLQSKCKFPGIETCERYFSEIFKRSIYRTSNGVWYPRNGFMGWHTNNNLPGLRLYLTYADEMEMSFFRYMDPVTRKIITSFDKKGWALRLFCIPQDGFFWHCVYSDCNRYSLGWHMPVSSNII